VALEPWSQPDALNGTTDGAPQLRAERASAQDKEIHPPQSTARISERPSAHLPIVLAARTRTPIHVSDPSAGFRASSLMRIRAAIGLGQAFACFAIFRPTL